jgi:hypothetical protein
LYFLPLRQRQEVQAVPRQDCLRLTQRRASSAPHRFTQRFAGDSAVVRRTSFHPIVISDAGSMPAFST